ncbi:hypothetical protein OUZ56_018566 [Daphnia magna]|uniref:Peptidase A2 domain-containing protein n=1 Tax=Daphnia magna TaxID=35525 RepID=A0ABQ9Z9D5_9CRUS|nr:hypothetical protein OUZ56_018566 [Daphnia magna]
MKSKKPEGKEPKVACAVIGRDQTTGRTNGDRQPTEEIWIDGRPVDALVDTGAIISVILLSLASKLKLKIVPWEGPMVVTTDGQPMNPRGKVSTTVTKKTRPWRRSTNSGTWRHPHGSEQLERNSEESESDGAGDVAENKCVASESANH